MRKIPPATEADGTVAVAMSDAAISIPFEGSLVLLDERGQRLFAYNASAAIIWDLHEQGLGSEEIGAALAEAYGIDIAVATADAGTTVARWERLGLLGGPIAAARRRKEPPPKPPVAGAPTIVTHYRLQGRVCRIAIAEPQIRDHVEAALRVFACDPAPADVTIEVATVDGPEPYKLLADGQEQFRLATAPEAVGAVFQYLLQRVHAGIDWLALIHGAAVVAPDGRAILLPGSGGSGKSTLAAWLSQRGYGYLADDMIALRAPDGAAFSWPMPHSVKRGSWPLLAPVFPALAWAPVERIHERELKFLAAPAADWERPPTPVGAMVFPRYEPFPQAPITALAPIHVIGHLFGDRLWLGGALTRARVQAFLAWVAEIPAFAIEYRTLDEAEALLATVLG